VVADWQFEIDDGVSTVLLGEGTPYRVYEFNHEKSDVQANLSSRAREDGSNRGRDYLGETTASFEIGIDCSTDPDPEPAVLDALAALRAIWNGDNVRREPGLRAVLRAKRPGREVVRCYGRPDKFAPATLTYTKVGYVPLACAFECDDPYFYSDTLGSESVPFIPTSLNGLTGPLTGPWINSASGVRSGQIDVGGELPAWLGWTVNGPILNPQIEVTERWTSKLLGTIAGDKSVTVDPTPWNRSARHADGANWGGKFSTSSIRMSRMQVPPGASEVLLRGVDGTGTSSLDLFWRSVWASY
jgi:hypothetical protein